MHTPFSQRTELLLGRQVMEQLARTRVILFGVGGVGSWCAEALVRTGVGGVTLVDNDVVCITNVNRQVQATAENVGRLKVHELCARLRTINPHVLIEARAEKYSCDHRGDFDLRAYDYVLDAIDSLSCKVDLLSTAMSSGGRVFSSMGAACKLDPGRIRIGSIWKTTGCPLARGVRRGLRQRGVTGDCLCVYSEEQIANRGGESVCGTGQCLCPRETDSRDSGDVWCERKARINGSLVHVTGAFGFHLAGLVIQDVVQHS